jgi:hypothetical protein
MKFSAKQVMYTLRSNLVTFLSDIRMLPFTIKLKVLSWWYGGGDKIPPQKLGNVLVGGEEAARDLKRAAALHELSEEIADKFNLPKERRQFSILVAHFFTGKIEDVELHEAIGKILNDEKVRRAMYNAMRAADWITVDDVNIFRTHNDWKAFVDWLHQPHEVKE